MLSETVRIVGAGIAGLTVALALRRRGFEVSIIERLPQFAPVGAGILLAPNAVQLLSCVGVSLRSLGHPITNLRVRDQHGRTLQELDLTRIPVHFGTALAFDRIELHNVLLASLPPTLVRLGTPYVPTSAAGEHTVIGADGIYSTVREAKVGPVPVCYSGYTCWRAICPNPGITEAFEDWGGAARVGVVPLSRNRIYVFLVKTAARGLPRQTSIGSIRAEFSGFSNPVPAVLDSLEEVDLLHHDIEELRRPVWGNKRTLLIGDAAHAMTPNQGQGASMAIEDAIVVPQIINAPDAAAALAGLRQSRAAAMQRSSRWLGRLAHWQTPFAMSVRNSLLRKVPQSLSERSYLRMIQAGMKLDQGNSPPDS